MTHAKEYSVSHGVWFKNDSFTNSIGEICSLSDFKATVGQKIITIETPFLYLSLILMSIPNV